MTDSISGILRLITSALGGGHPMRLLLGVSCSLLVKTAITISAKMYPESLLWLTLNEFGLYWYIPIIAPMFYFPLILGRRGAPESAIHQVNMVRLLIDQGGFTAAQRQMIWRSLIEKYLKAVQPDLSKPAKLAELFSDTVTETEKSPDSGTEE